MVIRFSCPYTSSQNGKAERKIRAINNIIRTILSQSGVPSNFWPHALQHATYLLNILLNKLLKNLSPTQLLYHRIPTYDHLRVFGCLCYPLIPSTKINKLQPRSTPCVFLGFPTNHHGYKCYDLSTKKIIISRHVIFDETSLLFASHTTNTSTYKAFTDTFNPIFYNSPPTNVPTTSPTPSSPIPNTTPGPNSQTSPLRDPTPSTDHAHNTPTDTYNITPSINSPSPTDTYNITSTSPASPTTSSTSNSPTVNTTQPTRTMTTCAMQGIDKPRVPFNLSASTSNLYPLPSNPKQALTNPNWHHAMTDEYKALVDNKTWILVPPTYACYSFYVDF
ncbi:uncharacterized protein [Rutidosis leptorrhynchoides]|uniref:uncharacterized protein n=1 Tax=Rutidosis leptorrhynchoides TaxID=125765 RepID=UPI003A98E3C0